MSFLEIVLIAVSLAMDAFAVSLAAAAAGMAGSPRPIFRLSFHFGLFQFLMPIVGWFAGLQIAHLIDAASHWIAFGLLALVGGRMIRSGLSADELRKPADPSRGLNLVLLSLATSIDALAVGLSLAMLDVSIWYPSAIIGIVTVVMSLLAIRLGHILGSRFGKVMETAGGVILVLIGLKIVIEKVG